MGKGYILNRPKRVAREENNINSHIEEQSNKTNEEEAKLSNGKVTENPEYMDQQIRYMINQAEEKEKNENQNIYEGVTVNDQQYEFQEMSFFEEKLKLHIPTSFMDMPAELARVRYPSSDRPQIIKTDKTGSINITLNLIPNGANENQILDITKAMKNLLTRLNPAYLFLEEGLENIEGKQVGFFEYKSPTITESMYTLMFFIELNHDGVMGSFSCTYDECEPWRPVARQIMQSVRVCPKMPEQADIFQGGQK